MPASADEDVAERLTKMSCRYPEPLLQRNWSAMTTMS
jgi:hypothetical protein